MKKKILLLIFACLILLAGCGKENSENDNNYLIEAEYDENVVLDTEEKIYDYAKELIDREITVRINGPETTISIGYEGRHEQDAIDYAFSAIKNGLKETAYEDYYLSIGGMDGQPLQYDPKPPLESSTIPVPENVPYNFIGTYGLSNIPLFEIVSSKESHETKAAEAIEILKKSMPEELWYIYIVDQNEKFLGEGYEGGYTPYVLSVRDSEKNMFSCEVPFQYYLSKYFNEIEYNGYSTQSYYENERGYKQYFFTIDEVSTNDRKQVEEAVKNIFNAMSATVKGEKVTVTIIVYPDTKQEIKMRTYDPAKDGDDENKALDWLNSKTK